uniref:Dynactin subunit 6 n=1 Tax=Geotrypetes seraphini TaxID=260995 RepID=A0A6P8P956_GEOSA|nr:dynactin subunit 6 isoform X1 [Geotrypetes seraphini]
MDYRALSLSALSSPPPFCLPGVLSDLRALAAGGMAELNKQHLKSLKIAPGAVVCVESEIKGDVTIGPRTVVHPKARIIAEAGPIVIGEGNLIEEQALIINGYPENIMPDAEKPDPKPMVIGTNNVFEVGCSSEAMKIGDNNVIESKAFVGRNVILTSGCIIGSCCSINTCEVIPENTVIYGAECLRRVQTERPQMPMRNTHQRKPNFSPAETEMTICLILGQQSSLFGSSTASEKQRAWQAIVRLVNVVHQNNREMEDLKKKWRMLRRETKRKQAANLKLPASERLALNTLELRVLQSFDEMAVTEVLGLDSARSATHESNVVMFFVAKASFFTLGAHSQLIMACTSGSTCSCKFNRVLKAYIFGLPFSS